MPRPAKPANWDEEIAPRLRPLLRELLDCRPYGIGDDREPPPREYGVYLFTSVNGHEYVGRTGLTERTRRAGGSGTSNFRRRLNGHLSDRLQSATFAYRRAQQAAEFPKGTRRELFDDPAFRHHFDEQRAAIADMEFRAVTIDDDVLSAVFEIYAAVVLDTPWNSFATS